MSSVVAGRKLFKASWQYSGAFRLELPSAFLSFVRQWSSGTEKLYRDSTALPHSRLSYKILSRATSLSSTRRRLGLQMFHRLYLGRNFRFAEEKLRI